MPNNPQHPGSNPTPAMSVFSHKPLEPLSLASDTGTAGDPLFEVNDHLLEAYIDGRNAARRLEHRAAPVYYSTLEVINWECGWDDMVAELSEGA